MEPKSLTALENEFKKLRCFYNTTVLAYQQADEFLGNKSKRRKKGTIQHPSIRRQTESMLRELILVRAISALETFLIDAIRDIFLATKVPFMDKSVRLEFSQEELIANNSPAQIFNRIINRETRKLTNGGFNDFIKYYKRRFGIDLSNIPPGYKILNEYHDRRHILVHRLGHTDEVYRKKYGTDIKKIEVDEGYVESLLNDIEIFSSSLGSLIETFISTSSRDVSMSSARYVVDIRFLKQDVPNCLQPNFQFWADDEYVMLSDILIGTSPAEDGRVRHYFKGSDRALRKLKQYLRKALRRLAITFVIVEDHVRQEKKLKIVSDAIIKQVQKELPEQPWSKGIHKEVAARLGLANSTVSAVIDILISRGVFKYQIDGKIIA